MTTSNTQHKIDKFKLGRELGRGGEGSVYEVVGQPNLVAKIYHQPIDRKKQQKLTTMVDLKNDSILKFATWPVEVIRVIGTQEITGFLMRKLQGKEIHKLYGPKTRLTEFPNANFAFLVHAATNLARVFSAIHESGNAIGDVNHGNFYVSDQAIVTLVDCDSFQITTPTNQYNCEVGVLMFQPPEFQKISSFRDVARNKNHDNFGLAVLIFQLLFMGRHPFAGRYLGSGDMPIEKAIQEYRFAYSKDAAQKSMQPPPMTLPLNAVGGNLASLFEKAFSVEGTKPNGRPSASEWVRALESFSNQLKRCSLNDNHNYLSSLSACPWCDLEARLGIVLFNIAIVQNQNQNRSSTFVLHAVWTQITRVQSPGPLPSLPAISQAGLTPSPFVKEQRKKGRHRGWIFVIPIVATIASYFLVSGATVWVAIIGFIISSIFYHSKDSSIKSELKKQNEIAKRNWDTLYSRYLKEATEESFTSKLKDLENKKKEYDNIPNVKQAKMQKIQANQYNRQLQAYLRRFQIEDTKIQGIGPSRKATLISFGIESAADINTNALYQVPGIGPSYSQKLLDWKSSIEKRFTYNPSVGVPQADLDAINKEISQMSNRLEQELLNGEAALKQLKSQIEYRRNSFLLEFEEIARVIAQTDLDLVQLKSFSFWGI